MIEKPASVRVAGWHDEAAIYDFLVNGLYKDNPLSLPFSPNVVLDQIQLATRKRLGVIGLIEDGEQIVGSVGVFMSAPAWFVDPKEVTWGRELWLYVRTFARHGTRHCRDLFEFMRWFRDGIRRDNVSNFEIITGPATRDRLELKERLWARYGHRSGASFILK